VLKTAGDTAGEKMKALQISNRSRRNRAGMAVGLVSLGGILKVFANL
jgi:hypothetical protein